MSAASVDYILNQTELTSIFASSDYINKVITMKKEGLAKTIKNLVAYDLLTASQVEAAEKVGLKVYTI